MSLDTSSSLHQLHDWLRDGGACTLAEASRRLDVTKRQVRRLIQELRDADVPVQERQRGREKEFFLPPEEHHAPGLPEPLTEHQVLALTVAAQIARAKLNPTPLAGHLESAVEALQTAFPDPALTFEADTEPNRWHFSDAPSVPIDPDIFWQLREAAKEKHPVHIDYYSASSGRRSTDRKIHPLLIAERRGSWLCVAYCHQRQTVLDFSMAAISAIRLCKDERFIPPASFDRSDYFAGRFGAVAGDAVQTVRLLVDAKRAPYFRRKIYHPSQQIETERDDGQLVVTYTVQGLEEIGAWVRSWGSKVKVLAPDALAMQVVEEAEAMQARYRD